MVSFRKASYIRNISEKGRFYDSIKCRSICRWCRYRTNESAYKNKEVDGFTTNPSLMAKAGVTDYKAFAEEAVREIPDASISFEVFSDDLDTMEKEAEILKQYGDNVFVKIPIVNSKGESTIELIKSYQ